MVIQTSPSEQPIKTTEISAAHAQTLASDQAVHIAFSVRQPSSENMATVLSIQLAETAVSESPAREGCPSTMQRTSRCLLKCIVQRWKGHEVITNSKAFCALFWQATDAVEAAIEAQRCLEGYSWPGQRGSQAKMSLHTGEYTSTLEEESCPLFYIAAQILDFACEGQIVISQATCALVEDALPAETDLYKIEEDCFSSSSLPYPLFQLIRFDVSGTDPNIETAEYPFYNLPAAFMTPLVGREQEEETLCLLLQKKHVRLLTITGPGGIGKTRLSLEVAARLRSLFPDGICFVPLSSISKPLLVLPTITQQLGLSFQVAKHNWHRGSITCLKDFLQDRRALLILDNFEQVVSAGPDLTDLLSCCPHLKLLITSRAVLHVQGEHIFSLLPLAIPRPFSRQTGEELIHYAAIELFIQRARAVKPDLVLNEANMQAIASICQQLDGLPLALELAAARIRLLPPQVMLPRLARRLEVLTGGLRDAPVRQQTLRNTLDWSYQLLDPLEQRLFRLMALFAGSGALEAIEKLSQTGEEPATESILQAVTSLVDKSLLFVLETEEEAPRLVMLSTLREYALELLQASGEHETLREAHARYYLTLVEQAERAGNGPQQAIWLRRLVREQENLREALLWALESETAETMNGRASLALRFVGSLFEFWVVRGHQEEWRTFLMRALACGESAPSAERAKALIAGANLALGQGDFAQVEHWSQQALAFSRQQGDQTVGLIACYLLAWAKRGVGRLAEAQTWAHKAVVLAREVGDPKQLAWALYTLAFIESEGGQYQFAAPYLQESIHLNQQLGYQRGLAWSQLRLKVIEASQAREPDILRPSLEECLASFLEIGDEEGIAYSYMLLGQLALLEGQGKQALPWLQKSAAWYQEIRHEGEGLNKALIVLARAQALHGERQEAGELAEELGRQAMATMRGARLASLLEGIAGIQATRGELVWASRLWGAAEQVRGCEGGPLAPMEHWEYEQALASVRTELGKARFARAWQQGRQLTVEQVVGEEGRVLREEPEQEEAPVKGRPSYPADLSEREVQILRLVAQGLTNAEMARMLTISEKTVAHHLTHIFNKTTSDNRAAAVAFAFRHGLA